MKALGYCRVSTSEQANSDLGLASQREKILREITHRGWELLELVEDTGSGKDLNRPGLARVLELLANHEADVLVVAKLDRLSRSIYDFAGLMLTAREQGWQLVLLDLGVDTTTSSGELVANVMVAVAQWERQRIGERTKEALCQAKKRGTHVGRPSSISPQLRRSILEMHRAGLGASAIAKTLNERKVKTARGGARWYPSTVRYVTQSTTTETHPLRTGAEPVG